MGSSLPIGPSTFSEMLQTAKLNKDQQQQFASLFAANRTDPSALWKAVTESLGSEVSDRLQVGGKVAALTLNNAPLMGRINALRGNDGLTDAVQLAEEGLYEDSQWKDLLDGVEIPDLVTGADDAERRTNFGKYLGAQVRLSFPTACVAHMVEKGDVAVGTPEKVSKFLKTHQGKFEIGVQPIEQYIAENKLRVAAATINELKRIQRVYQLTPSDRALSVLLGRGIDSAYQIVHYGREAFIRDLAVELGDGDEARQIYDKAAQVYNAVLNVSVNFLLAKNGISLGATPADGGDAAPDAAVAGGRSGFVLQPGLRAPRADG